MTVWLSPEQVAERLGVCRKTALALMHQMPHSVIGGTVKQRIRVSEQNLDLWMAKRSAGDSPVRAVSAGTHRKLERR